MKNRFILSALSLLGFSGCSSSEGIFVFTEPDMYGTPLAEYQFKGELKDSDGNSVKGIEVQIDGVNKISSNEDGNFNSSFTSEAIGSHSVEFTDIDGADNGGEFLSKELEVSQDDATDKDGFSYTFDLGAVTLDKKSDEQ